MCVPGQNYGMILCVRPWARGEEGCFVYDLEPELDKYTYFEYFPVPQQWKDVFVSWNQS